MAFRSHVFRPMDPDSGSNRLIAVLTLLAGLTAAWLTSSADRSAWLIVEAAGTTFITWALTREVDPDHQLTALIAGVFGGVWALAGFEVAILPMIGLLMTARLLVESTGRRPLITDVGGMAVAASLISFTSLGWVAGFGWAVAIYLDNQMAETRDRRAVIGASGAALGSSLVATLADVFPREVPTLRPLLAIGLGLLALLAVVREPPPPTSLTDSRRKAFLRKDRLHAARAAVGLLVFVGALISGDQAPALVPVAAGLILAMAASEIERRRGPVL